MYETHGEFYVTDNAEELAVGDRINYQHRYSKEFFWSRPHEVIEVTANQFTIKPLEKPMNSDPQRIHTGYKNRRGLSWVWAVWPKSSLKDYKEDQPEVDDGDL